MLIKQYVVRAVNNVRCAREENIQNFLTFLQSTLKGEGKFQCKWRNRRRRAESASMLNSGCQFGRRKIMRSRMREKVRTPFSELGGERKGRRKKKCSPLRAATRQIIYCLRAFPRQFLKFVFDNLSTTSSKRYWKVEMLIFEPAALSHSLYSRVVVPRGTDERRYSRAQLCDVINIL